MRVESTARWVAVRVAATQPSPMPPWSAMRRTCRGGQVRDLGGFVSSAGQAGEDQGEAAQASVSWHHSFTFSMG